MQPSSEAATVAEPVAAIAEPATVSGTHPITGRPLTARLFQADCRDVLRSLADNSIDSVVTDPPYALVSIVKRFGKPGSAPAVGNDAYQRASAGFMGKQWDTGETAFSEEFWAEVLRVLKPGGHVVAFSGTRTYHRMAVAIEDAGFEIRDQLGWLYGSGFPKSHDVSKGIDKMDATHERRARNLRFTEWMRSTGLTSRQVNETTGTVMASHYLTDKEQPAVATREHLEMLRPLISVEVPDWVERLVDERTVESENFKSREVVGQHDKPSHASAWRHTYGDGVVGAIGDVTLALTPDAIKWQGWGTALKPAWEPICLARKPLEGTVAANVLRWGTGALNIDGCRVATGDTLSFGSRELGDGIKYGKCKPTTEGVQNDAGRWPANIAHDGSDEVLAGFPETASGSRKAGDYGLMGYHGADAASMPAVDGDSGSAARFFYCAKASRADRDEGLAEFQGKSDSAHRKTNVEEAGDNPYLRGVTVRKNTHPTVKPTALMQWLCRMVTPPGGTVLDPFMGSGSTGKAALREGFDFVGCEREDEYMPIAKARVASGLRLAPRPADKRPANDNSTDDLFTAAGAT